MVKIIHLGVILDEFMGQEPIIKIQSIDNSIKKTTHLKPPTHISQIESSMNSSPSITRLKQHNLQIEDRKNRDMSKFVETRVNIFKNLNRTEQHERYTRTFNNPVNPNEGIDQTHAENAKAELNFKGNRI